MNDLFKNNPSRPSENGESWESRLKRMRQGRPAGSAEAAADVKTVRSGLVPGRYTKEQAAANRYVLGEYLKQWEAEHNLNAERHEAPETDTAVLLQEDWLNAQSALQGEAGAETVARTATVWVNPKRAAVPPAGFQTASEEVGTEGDCPASVPVSVNVLEPSAVPSNRPVLCLSESELLERLTARLLPHLTDAVNGMVRTAVQRQAVQLTFQLQKSLEGETPDLVREVLDYNLKAAFGEIKYKLKTQK